MNNPIVFVYGGQGSHYYNMGKELFANNEVFRKSLLELDELVTRYIDQSIVDILYKPDVSAGMILDEIIYTHPAIFMLEYALHQVLVKKGISPDFIVGTSLGEYTCMALSGVLSVEESLDCIMKQALLLKEKCRKSGMLAIVSDPVLFSATPLLRDNTEIASINYKSHFVISGDNEVLATVEKYLTRQTILYQRLPVQYGFHSACIDHIATEYNNYTDKFTYSRPKIPYVTSINGKLVNDEVNSKFLWDVIREPIRFIQSVQYLEKYEQNLFIDVGPSGTLANFAKQILKDAENRCFSIVTPFHQEEKKINQIEALLR